MAKNYRMKNPVNHVKATIGKFQTKHPYMALLFEFPLVAGGVAGAAEAMGLDGFGFFRPILKVPVAGTIYGKVADATKKVLG